jgi:hypothetical protein
MAIRIRKLGHSHKLTVPTTRKGISVSQAARQVAQNKATINHPGASPVPYDESGPEMRNGGIHINPANKGKFTATKKATGKSTEELTHSSNPVTRKRAIFAQNARKWHHHPGGGWIEQYADGGRTINPAMGGLMIGGQQAYPPTVQYPPEYPLGGSIQSMGSAVSMIPGVGSIFGMALKGIGGQMAKDEQAKSLLRQTQLSTIDPTVDGNDRATFAWGGRLPETDSFSPSGLTLGRVPGYGKSTDRDRDPGMGFDWTINRPGRAGEIKNWSQDTMANVHRHTYDEGGEVPVELEKQEVYQEPNGDMGQVNGPSHEEGGVKMQLPEQSFVWSDKLKSHSGRTFAEEAAKLARMKAKYEKILGKQ